MPSAGHSIDHLAWGRSTGQGRQRSQDAGVTFLSNPNPRGYPRATWRRRRRRRRSVIRRLFCAQTDQLTHRIVFLDGPEGVRIELVASGSGRALNLTTKVAKKRSDSRFFVVKTDYLRQSSPSGSAS